jgi:hypothetical protein
VPQAFHSLLLSGTLHIHWLRAPSVTPRASGLSVFCFQPRSFSSKARKRLPSRQSLAWLDSVFFIVEFIIPTSLGFYAEISNADGAGSPPKKLSSTFRCESVGLFSADGEVAF